MDIQQILAVKEAHEAELMAKANVVGVGIGFRQQRQTRSDEVVLVVIVEKKLPRAQLAPEDIIPGVIEGVPVDVQESGRLVPQ
ncbi:MAG: hypothetical protein H6654_00445 [Ardenticatenaceae bacterium]|nr:hypothetical protein [Anaerolineales bacterium]MCB8940669.1 hypothetical protein [Ardenticatenaceae bacterium]MCB8971999.1 hypothetical protein [Ardenticatenaceae bacterium]